MNSGTNSPKPYKFNKCLCNDARDPSEYENVFEKWLRRRLDYCVIQETGQHAPPGLLHTVLHAGNTAVDVERLLRDELWIQNKTPNSEYFGHDLVNYDLPDKIKETINYRFGHHQQQDLPVLSQLPLFGYKNKSEGYPVSLHYMCTVPVWGANLHSSTCKLSHQLETPLSWPLGSPDHKFNVKKLIKSEFNDGHRLSEAQFSNYSPLTSKSTDTPKNFQSKVCSQNNKAIPYLPTSMDMAVGPYVPNSVHTRISSQNNKGFQISKHEGFSKKGF